MVFIFYSVLLDYAFPYKVDTNGVEEVLVKWIFLQKHEYESLLNPSPPLKGLGFQMM